MEISQVKGVVSNETPPTHNNRSRGAGGAHGPSVDIHEAVSKGNIEAVKQHIEAGTDVNSALRGVAKYGQKEIAELLIANGANVNTKDSSGRTL